VDRRKYTRKLLDPIHISDMQATDRFMLLARYGTILNASAAGLLIEVKRGDLSPKMLEAKFPLHAIEGEFVTMKIAEMELEIDGRIVRVCHTEQEGVEIAVDFTENAPTYWRECLAELLPGLGEIEPVAPPHAADLQRHEID
jgi:hypothetical protein